LRFLLQYHGSGSNAFTMAYISDAQAHKIAGAQFTVDAKVKQCKLAQSFLHLQTNLNRPA